MRHFVTSSSQFEMLQNFQDSSGRVIGRFVAVPLPEEYLDEEFPSDEELDRRLRESPRYTTDQVLERLRSLRGSR
jgi:hypothetical protein